MAKPLERVLKWLLPVLIVIEIVLVWTGCLDRGAAIDPGYATLTGNGADTVEFGPVVVDIYDAVTDTWSTATLFDSEVRGLMQTVTVGRKVLFAGGPSGREGSAFFGASAAVDIYDAPINTWSMAELSQIRAGLAVVALGGKALIAGGCIGDCFHTVDIYNATTDTWSVAALSQARGAVMATTVGTKALFAGGCSGSYCATPHTEVDIYDGSTGQWTTATLSHPRGNGAAVTVGSKALFAGGADEWPGEFGSGHLRGCHRHVEHRYSVSGTDRANSDQCRHQGTHYRRDGQRQEQPGGHLRRCYGYLVRRYVIPAIWLRHRDHYIGEQGFLCR